MHAERRRDMRLAGARPADQDDIVGHIDEVTPMKLADEGFIDFAAGKVEARKVAVSGEPGALQLVGHGPHFPFCGFGFQKLGQHRDCGLERGRALSHEISDGLRHSVHLQTAQHDDDRTAGWIMTHDGSLPPHAACRSDQRWPVAHWPGATPAAPSQAVY